MQERAISPTRSRARARIFARAPVRVVGRNSRRRAFIALDVLCVLLVGLYFLVDVRIDRTDAVADHDLRPMEGPGQDWLLVASDRTYTGPRRITTVQLLHIPQAGGKPTLICLPPLTVAPVPGHGHGRNTFEAAFEFGGPKLLTAAVEGAIKIRVDRYLESFSAAPPPSSRERPGCRLGVIDAPIGWGTDPSVVLNPARSVPLSMKLLRSLRIDEADHIHHFIRLFQAAQKLRNGAGITIMIPIKQSASIAGIGPAIILNEGKVDELAKTIVADRPPHN